MCEPALRSRRGHLCLPAITVVLLVAGSSALASPLDFNLILRQITGLSYRDTQCGFKLLDRQRTRPLFQLMVVDHFAFDVELLLLARRWGFELREVPVEWRHVEASRVRPVRHSSQMLGALLALWFRRLAGRLPARPAHLASGS